MAESTALVPAFSQSVHESLAELRRIAARAKSRHDPALRRATEEERALAETQRKPFTCKGVSTRTGLPCAAPRVRATEYCRKHSSSLPCVKAKAARRLAALVDPALAALEHCITQRDNLVVSQKAAADALDRNGVGALVAARVRAAEKDRDSSHIEITIGFLGTPSDRPPTLVVSTPTPKAALGPGAHREPEES